MLLPKRGCYACMLGSSRIKVYRVCSSYTEKKYIDISIRECEDKPPNIKNVPFRTDAPARIRDVFQADVSNGGPAQSLCTECFLKA